MKQPFIPDDPGVDQNETARSGERVIAFALCAMSGALFAAFIGLLTWGLR